MRDIKFRAWIDEYDCYFHNFSMMSSSVGNEQPMIEVTLPSGGHSDLKKWFNANFYTLEQYAGLKDKNGVEIYEGDIVINAGIKEVVKMELKECSGNQHNFGSVSILVLNAYDPGREVIGNINQNPELLEDK